jgi:hypothetical protein
MHSCSPVHWIITPPVAYPGIFFGGVQQIQLRTEGRENGDLGAVAPSLGFHPICKWAKPVFWLGCYRCIFHGTGNLAQLFHTFGIFGGGGCTPQTPPLGTPVHTSLHVSGVSTAHRQEVECTSIYARGKLYVIFLSWLSAAGDSHIEYNTCHIYTFSILVMG